VHSRETIDRVLADRSGGIPAATIARTHGLPRSTVRDWSAGHLPRTARAPLDEPWLRPEFAAEAYCRLLGTYLGDGHIAREARTCLLRIACDSAYPGLIADTVNDLRALRPSHAIHVARRPSTNCIVVAARWQLWPTVFPQHGAGPKHLRRIELADWQLTLTTRHPEAFVRGLLNSDGCRYLNRVIARGREYAYPSYGFKNASDDIHRLLREHLDLLGIAWRRANGRTTAITTRAGVARLDAFVGPKR
jgi:hypothetical protein